MATRLDRKKILRQTTLGITVTDFALVVELVQFEPN
jgi:hypothetical protein